MIRDQIARVMRERGKVCVILTWQIQILQRRVLLQSLRNRLCIVVSDIFPCFEHEKRDESEYVKSKHHIKTNTQQQYLKQCPNHGYSRMQHSSYHLGWKTSNLKKKASRLNTTHILLLHSFRCRTHTWYEIKSRVMRERGKVCVILTVQS
jgi:hypothetical protein